METFDRNDPIEQLAELERFIKTSGGETPECLEGWSIYMTFRKHSASKGQPDLKIYPKDGFVAKDNTKDKAFYRSRLEVCRALGLQPAKPEKVPKKPKVPSARGKAFNKDADDGQADEIDDSKESDGKHR